MRLIARDARTGKYIDSITTNQEGERLFRKDFSECRIEQAW